MSLVNSRKKLQGSSRELAFLRERRRKPNDSQERALIKPFLFFK
jgi:hypothetical protein